MAVSFWYSTPLRLLPAKVLTTSGTTVSTSWAIRPISWSLLLGSFQSYWTPWSLLIVANGSLRGVIFVLRVPSEIAITFVASSVVATLTTPVPLVVSVIFLFAAAVTVAPPAEALILTAAAPVPVVEISIPPVPASISIPPAEWDGYNSTAAASASPPVKLRHVS